MGDDASDERHLFGERRETATGFLASAMGVVRVELAPDRLGGFGIVERCHAADIAAGGGELAVATEEDVLLAGESRETFTPLGFGPAAAVGIEDETVYAASPEGTVAATPLTAVDGTATEWDRRGEVSGPSSFDGSVLATASGVVRVAPAFEALGLDGATDVTQGESLLAGSPDGLFEYDNGEWLRRFDRPIRQVVAGEDAVFVVTETGQLFRDADTLWTEVSLSEGTRAAAVAPGRSLYVVTEAGDVFISAEPTAATDGFGGRESEPLGVREIRAFTLDS
ncbi:HVO_0234 family beta-propeller protein [Halovenus salina]|uniref:HVO-0234-like beta-propeller domain-containing protein n=1 Tax=Halovenus salina TaxID=1510225 RepID=A0ABD5VYK6_9EURY|nr:hypothetical protein [Halovenus salina]